MMRPFGILVPLLASHGRVLRNSSDPGERDDAEWQRARKDKAKEKAMSLDTLATALAICERENGPGQNMKGILKPTRHQVVAFDPKTWKESFLSHNERIAVLSVFGKKGILQAGPKKLPCDR